jgi:hypothetical protein
VQPSVGSWECSLQASSTTDLIPVYPGRPPVLRVGPSWVYVSVHDAEFLRKHAEHRQRVTSWHPDNKSRKWVRGAPSRPKKFRQVMGAYLQWLMSEMIWYEKIGLGPPIPIPHSIAQRVQELRGAHRWMNRPRSR